MSSNVSATPAKRAILALDKKQLTPAHTPGAKASHSNRSADPPTEPGGMVRMFLSPSSPTATRHFRSADSIPWSQGSAVRVLFKGGDPEPRQYVPQPIPRDSSKAAKSAAAIPASQRANIVYGNTLAAPPIPAGASISQLEAEPDELKTPDVSIIYDDRVRGVIAAAPQARSYADALGVASTAAPRAAAVIDLSAVAQVDRERQGRDAAYRGMIGAKDFLQMPNEGRCNARYLRFSQAGISAAFFNEHRQLTGTVFDLIAALREDRVLPSSIPPVEIGIVWTDSFGHNPSTTKTSTSCIPRVYCFDNRRLYVFQQADKPIPYVKADANRVRWQLDEHNGGARSKLDRNIWNHNGAYVFVRHNRGQVFWNGRQGDFVANPKYQSILSHRNAHPDEIDYAIQAQERAKAHTAAIAAMRRDVAKQLLFA